MTLRPFKIRLYGYSDDCLQSKLDYSRKVSVSTKEKAKKKLRELSEAIYNPNNGVVLEFSDINNDGLTNIIINDRWYL